MNILKTETMKKMLKNLWDKVISWIKAEWSKFQNSQAYETACKMASFLAIALWVVGVAGGIGYALYCDAYVIAIAIVAVGAMSFPYVRESLKTLTK